jgi:hypothetical protein
MRMVAALASSEGWNWTPPKPIHDLLALTTRPKTRVARSVTSPMP